MAHEISIVTDVESIGPGFVRCSVRGPKAKFDRVALGVANNVHSWDNIIREIHKDYQSTPESEQTYDSSAYSILTFVASRAEIETFNESPFAFEFLLDQALITFPIEPVIDTGETVLVPSIEASFTNGNSASDTDNDYSTLDVPNDASANNIVKFRVLGTNDAPTVVSNVNWLANIRVSLVISGDNARLYNITYDRVANEETETREGTLTATVAGVTSVLTITQAAGEAGNFIGTEANKLYFADPTTGMILTEIRNGRGPTNGNFDLYGVGAPRSRVNYVATNQGRGSLWSITFRSGNSGFTTIRGVRYTRLRFRYTKRANTSGSEVRENIAIFQTSGDRSFRSDNITFISA